LLTISPKQAFTLTKVAPDEIVYELCIRLKDVPGAIAETAKLLSDSGVNIKSGSLFYSPKSNNIGFWTSFIDLSKANISIEKLDQKLQKLPPVLDVKFEKPKPAPYEIMHFPVMHENSRAIVMPTELFSSMLGGVERILTPSGFSAVFYDSGKKAGKYNAEYLQKKFGLEKNEDLIQVLIQKVKAIGWGLITVDKIAIKRSSATLIIKENFEALVQKKKPYRVCHWSRGFIAGYFSVVFSKPVESVEVKCLATGDEHCEFDIRPEREQEK
jgi:predicted hydrocarbon binding protein